METSIPNDLDVLTGIITALKKLSKEDQKRTLQSVAMFLNISVQESNSPSVISALSRNTSVSVPSKASFSEDRTLSAKDFMRDKGPRTDIEKATCLAYYLTHYKDTPHFKTIDISALNTEAALPKFSNASIAVDNATRTGFLVQANKGSKQISAAGETYVQHLPDRVAAKSGAASMRPVRKTRKTIAKRPLTPK